MWAGPSHPLEPISYHLHPVISFILFKARCALGFSWTYEACSLYTLWFLCPDLYLAPAITSWSEIAPPVCLFVYYLSSPPGCRPSDGDRQCLPPHSCIPSNPGLSLAHGKHQTHFFEWMNKWISERFPAKHNRTKQTILPIKPRLISANFHFTSWQWTTGITSIWFYRLL